MRLSMKTITYEVYNEDGSITYETSEIVELPLFATAEEFSEFINNAFTRNKDNDNKELTAEDIEDILNYESNFSLDGHHDHLFF
jgi:hypothetical protein